MKKEELPKTENLRELQDWFAKNFKQIREFDLSSLGFHNWLKEYYPHLIRK